MTRRLRGDMRLCLRWCAPCAASLESSTASLVRVHVVRLTLNDPVCCMRPPKRRYQQFKTLFIAFQYLRSSESELTLPANTNKSTIATLLRAFEDVQVHVLLLNSRQRQIICSFSC